MKWSIIADSSCDIHKLETVNEDISFSTVPFTISVENREFVDDKNLRVEEMIYAMEKSKEASHTACPSPLAWYEQFEKADNLIAITISSELSGSYNSALAAKSMILEKYPDKKVAVLDSLSAGPEIALMIEKLRDLIERKLDFDLVIESMKQYMKKTHVVYSLSSFDNLIKNGRMGKLTGFIAGKLNFRGIGIASEKGTICIKQKVRGDNKALAAILQDMQERGNTIKKVVISHCQNIEFAEKLKCEILNIWSNAEIKIVSSRGLCSYYAERGGLIIGF